MYASEHVLRKIHHCTFRSQKLDSNFWMTFFTEICLFTQANFRLTFFVTAQTAFYRCTFRFITAHFVHPCTLKQALVCIVAYRLHNLDIIDLLSVMSRKLVYYTWALKINALIQVLFIYTLLVKKPFSYSSTITKTREINQQTKLL